MNKYYIRGNKWVKDNVPSTKQKEDITTNKTIECMICNKLVSTYVSIIRLDWYIQTGTYDPAGYCCYSCANTHTLNKWIYYMNKDGTRYTPDLMSVGTPHTDRFGVVDPTKNRIDEINKHRLQAKNYVERMKKTGILAKHKKIRVRTTTGATTLAQRQIEWRKDKTWDLMMKMIDGEIKDV